MALYDPQKVASEMDAQDRTREEMRSRRGSAPAAGTSYDAPPKPPPPDYETCDTPLEYLGEGKVPFLVGAEMVFFHPKRPVHLMPRPTAERLVERDPLTWKIAKSVPEYPESEAAVEEHFDIDTAEGRGKLRQAFFNDPEGTYRVITGTLWAKIEQLERDLAGERERGANLVSEIAALRSGQNPPPTPPPAPKPTAAARPSATTSFEGVDPALLARILPYVEDPMRLDAAMTAAKLNGGQQGSLRSSATEFAEFRTQESAAKFASKLDKYLPNDGSESVQTAEGDDPDGLVSGASAGAGADNDNDPTDQ